MFQNFVTVRKKKLISYKKTLSWYQMEFKKNNSKWLSLSQSVSLHIFQLKLSNKYVRHWTKRVINVQIKVNRFQLICYVFYKTLIIFYPQFMPENNFITFKTKLCNKCILTWIDTQKGNWVQKNNHFNKSLT